MTDNGLLSLRSRQALQMQKKITETFKAELEEAKQSKACLAATAADPLEPEQQPELQLLASGSPPRGSNEVGATTAVDAAAGRQVEADARAAVQLALAQKHAAELAMEMAVASLAG